jgi:cobalamin synthase
MIDGIIFGLSYWTIFPFKSKYNNNTIFLKGLIYSLFIAGGILSIVLIMIYYILPFNNIVNSIIVAIIYPFLYGFLHLEGFIDTIDGLYATLSKDPYQAMKEPYIGAIGAMYGMGIYLLKVVLIAFILYKHFFWVLIVSFSISRISIIFSFDYSFKDGFAKQLQQSYQKTFFDKILYPCKIIYTIILNKITKQIKLLNGDILGFMIEICELIILFIGVMIAV